MDSKTLITNVQNKPAIWDRRRPGYAHRGKVDACWQEISEQMGVPECSLRKKWKYLRDQFCVEYGRVLQLGLTDESEDDSIPRWTHFKDLSFLKDVVRPRIPNSIGRNGKENDKIETLFFDEDNETLSSVKIEEDEISWTADDYNTINQNIDDDINLRVKRNALSNSVEETKKIKVENSTLERVILNDENNEEMMFFKSLLSHIQKIPENKKLLFRCKIIEIVQEFGYPLNN